MPQATDILLVFRFLAFATARTCYSLLCFLLVMSLFTVLGLIPLDQHFTVTLHTFWVDGVSVFVKTNVFSFVPHV
jgi:hypothetical protein